MSRVESVMGLILRRLLYVVPRTGFEPAQLALLAPETSASTNSATWASQSEFTLAY